MTCCTNSSSKKQITVQTVDIKFIAVSRCIKYSSILSYYYC